MKKIIFITILIILVGLFAFHFVAANQAEEQIDTIIQEQIEASASSLSVQYSSIEVSSFSGDVQFEDVTIVEGNDIQRTRRMNVDLRYLDFLNIYLGGVEYGLKNINAGDIVLSRTSYLNRQSLQEYSIDTLNIQYRGHMWDAIQSIFTEQPTAFKHMVDLKGANARYTKPGASLGTFKADSAFSRFEIPEGPTRWQQEGTHQFTFKNVSWTPPASFQNKYGFFIQGFGFALDAIPINEAGAAYTMRNDSEIEIMDGIASTDLFTAQFEGFIATDSTWAEAEFNPLMVSLVDLSEQFKNVLTNIEQLLGLNLPVKTDGIQFQLVGPVSNPGMQQKP